MAYDGWGGESWHLLSGDAWRDLQHLLRAPRTVASGQVLSDSGGWLLVDKIDGW